MIKIDGSYGSGGGQIVRTAAALSAVTKKPCRVFNVRSDRPNPGLAQQHLLGIQALAQFCNAKLEGDYLGSEEIIFSPGPNKIDGNRISNNISVNIPTAGSITLVLKALIPSTLSAYSTRRSAELSRTPSGQTPSPVKITFNGGATDTFFSPTFDYFQYVFLKIVEKMGIKIDVNVIKRGYYPEGGAKVEVTIYPSKLKNLNLTERGSLKKITAISRASENLKSKLVAERQMAGVREILGKLSLPVKEKVEYYQTQCPGSQICLVGEFENTVIGADNLGKLGKRAEDVGKEAALELLKEQKPEACLDKYSADQILPYMAMSEYKSSVTVSEITDHCKTNIWVIEKFIDGRFEIKNNLITWLSKKT